MTFSRRDEPFQTSISFCALHNNHCVFDTQYNKLSIAERLSHICNYLGDVYALKLIMLSLQSSNSGCRDCKILVWDFGFQLGFANAEFR